MKALRYVANISYNDVCKLFSVLWVETAFEDVLNAVVQEFQIPSEEVTEKILCDFDGTSLTLDSFEDYVHRSISEGRVPKFRVIPLPVSDNAVTSTSTSQSECEEDVEQQLPQEADFNTRASNLFSKFSRIEENLNNAENKLRLMTEPTPKVDIDGLHRELERRKTKLDLLGRALFEFESSLKTKEEILNQRDIDLNERRKRLQRQDERLRNQEVKMTCQKCEVAPQYQLEESLYGLSTDMNTRRQHLDEHAYALNLEEAMLDEGKNNINSGRMIVQPKRKRCQMEVDSWNLDEKDEETKYNEGASTSNQQRSRDLSERGLMELETEVSKQKAKRISSVGNFR